MRRRARPGSGCACRCSTRCWPPPIVRVPALLLTSANIAGEPPATSFDELEPIADIATVALDGGTCPGGVPSTVVDITGDDPVIVREGPVSLAELRARLQ